MTSRQGTLKKLKILCLHGFGTNKEFMKMQTEILRKDLQAIAELIYVDGPVQIPLSMITDPKVINNIQGHPYSWFDFRKTNKTRNIQEVVAEMANIRAKIEEASDYYDGVIGFSQGSMAFQYLLWFHSMGYLDWPVINQIKFFINFSADTIRMNLKGLNYKRFQIPSLHFLSEEDFVFHRCILSPSIFKNPEVIFHSFGHRFPVLGLRQKQKLRVFLKKHGLGQKDNGGIEQQSRL